MPASTSTTLNTGAKMPTLGLGTWRSRLGAVEKAVEHALKNGYRHIDTATGYANEKEVGVGLKASGVPREEIFLTTKLNNTDHRDVPAALENSLTQLDTPYLDLWLMHWPAPMKDGKADKEHDWRDTWRAMEKVFKEHPEKVKAIGVSNFSVKYLGELFKFATVVPAVNQIESHPSCMQEDIVQECRKHDIVITAYSPLGSDGAPLREEPVVQKLAEKYGVAPSNILISLQANRPGVNVIPKSVTLTRIDENAKLVDLSDEDVLELTALEQKNHNRVWQDMADTTSSSPKTGLLAATTSLSQPRSHQGELEFDSGINTSAAWTVSLNNPDGSPRLSVTGGGNAGVPTTVKEEEDAGEPPQSVDGDDGAFAEEIRLARALYAFQGKAEFRELTRVEAGDELEIVKEDVGEGWSLARLASSARERDEDEDGAREMGLIPRSYYIFTADFSYSDGLEVPPHHSRQRSRREASTGSITPRGGSPTPSTKPLVPQTTGEWFPSFRRSLLGGKSLNRFSSFVTTGAEEFVLQGSSSDTPAPHPPRIPSDFEEDVKRASVLGHLAEAEKHYVEAGPSWRAKVPPFHVLVHSPNKRTSTLSGAYTVYAVTSVFGVLSHSRSSSDASDPETDEDPDDEPPEPMRITVHRRFSHFVALHTALTRLLPGIALPPLPEKQYAGRFSDDFVEARRGDLERYINRVARHPVARYAEVLTFFLGCESDVEWKKQLPYYLSLPAKGPSFFANVYHPAFNVDAEEASEAIDRFMNHTRAVGKGVQGLRNIFGKVREARVEMSKAERLLSYSLLSMVTAKPLASAPTTGLREEEEEDGEQNSATHGHVNEDGAWCWREGCESCLKLTKAMQKTSETLQIVADLYDDHARRTQLATHEAFKNVAHPATLYAPVVDTHKSTLTRYHDSIREGREDEEMAARCETVLNTTMAEMDTYHAQKLEDFQELAKEHLDGEIALYEQILSRLRTTRQAFDEPQYDELGQGARQPSIYERELEHPRLNPAPLSQPCPHVFDSAPMRPVSVAIHEGVGMILGAPGRASVFGKFW
ncbi:hypothetical protein GSI_14441 [Ganoderma sinense ZZ0214-1]|uniref:Uncharacterized protein n=1 Tax=Ganoderma sinense ZZ0214-1 TaxID=1077348 RepID=A0A2G8RNN8_9APHY|nr:hypothetical protein GSI_14441 [Ganoderma sinense ZZ0214-1]